MKREIKRATETDRAKEKELIWQKKKFVFACFSYTISSYIGLQVYKEFSHSVSSCAFAIVRNGRDKYQRYKEKVKKKRAKVGVE